MACETIVKQCMNAYAANFSKPQTWEYGAYPIWLRATHDVQDMDLWDATIAVCSRKWDFPPQLGDILAEVEKKIKLDGGEGLTRKTYEFCADCKMHEGIRYTVAHYTWVHSGQYVASERICGCSCQGSRDRYPNMMLYTKRVQLLENNKEIDYRGMYITSSSHHYLTLEQRDPKYYAIVQARKAEREAKGEKNPYQIHVDVILEANERAKRERSTSP
jgi:hypothetical protein